MKGKYFRYIILFAFLSVSLGSLLFAAAKDVTAKSNEKENTTTEVDCSGNAEKDLTSNSKTNTGSDNTSKSDEKLVVAQSPCGGMGAGAMTGSQTGTGTMSGMGMGMSGTGTGTMSSMGMGVMGTGTGTGAMSGMGMGMGTGTGTAGTP